MLQWISVDALSLRVLDDLPALDVDYPLRHTLGQYETGTAHLNLAGAPPEWQRATLPGAAILACYDDTDAARSIQWAGLITTRTRGPIDVVDLSLVTLEGYCDRRYAGNADYPATGANMIVTGLITGFVADTGGIPIALAYATPGAGIVLDRFYKASDFTKVYQRLQELMAYPGGPEWTIQWAWNPDGEHLNPTLWVGDRIGSPSTPGMAPAAGFDMPGCLTDFQMLEDYTDGKGATRVTAYSSGSGDAIPTSGPVSAAGTGGRPTYEFAWQPSSSITDPLTLAGYAAKAAAQLAPGSVAVALTAALSNPGTPRYGVDWSIGDDLSYQIGGPDDAGVETVLAVPGGITGTGRAISYELSADTISPILAQAALYTAPAGA